MRNLPTKQESHPPAQNSPLLYHKSRQHPPLSANHYGPYHRTPKHTREGRDPHHCQPWVFPSGHIPPLLYHNHGARNSRLVPQACLPMVWPPEKGYHRSGPSIYLAFWTSTIQPDRCPTKHFHSVPPQNRWIIQTEEPMDRTIPSHSYFDGPRRLD